MDLDNNHPFKNLDQLVNRNLDKSVAFLLLLTILPVVVMIALAIRMESDGPILEEREAKKFDGTHVKVYKFRTQLWRVPARTKSVMHHIGLTRVGRFLRETGLEELPVLLNVVKGDVSLAGNPQE